MERQHSIHFMNKNIFRLALASFILIGTLRADGPPLINYQGRVAVGAVNFDGGGLFKFALVNADGTTTFWSNDGTSVAGGEPAAAVSLAVSKGLYSVLLGDVSVANMSALPAVAFQNADVRLRVWFDDGVNGSQLLAPDSRLAPTAYLADGAVTSANIADAAITAGKIAPAAITGAHLAPAALDFSHLMVPAAPGAGQVLSFDGVSLNWAAPGAGDGIWSLDGALAYRIGSVSIGTATPNPGYMLAVNGAAQFTPGGSGGTMQFGTPNTETGMTIGGGLSARADVRFDGNTLKLVAGPAGFVPSTFNGLVIDTAGNVGTGVLSPAAKLHVANASDSVTHLIESGGGTNAWSQVQFRNATGTWHVGTSRDFNDNQLYFSRAGIVQLGLQPNGDAYLSGSLFAIGDITGTRLVLRADPVAPTNAAVLCGDAGVINFIPYNTALGRAMNLVVHDATVRTLTITGGSDLAEPFPMKEDAIEQGAVVVIDDEHPGRLRRSTRAYDTRVAGVVSGAGGIHAGISLRQDGALDRGQNVALTGRVYVRADARYGAIRPGDLLTTSDTPGRAMKASDRERTHGAVLGKAMTALEEGEGEVLVLVSLQ
jgi:hypothetical protein